MRRLTYQEIAQAQVCCIPAPNFEVSLVPFSQSELTEVVYVVIYSSARMARAHTLDLPIIGNGICP